MYQSSSPTCSLSSECKFIIDNLFYLELFQNPELPHLRPARPIYCFAMTGMGFALHGFIKNDVRKAVDLIHYMNGHVRRTFHENLILIAKDTRCEQYRVGFVFNNLYVNCFSDCDHHGTESTDYEMGRRVLG